MDSSIGRSVLKIKGSVSANNFADFSGMNLLGHIVYLQMCLMKPAIATFHVELVTTADVSVRLTFSTLYEQPRFLGRSLRLPLPPRSGWVNMFFDVDQILMLHCPVAENGTPWKMKSIKVTNIGFSFSYMCPSNSTNPSEFNFARICLCGMY